MRQNAFAADPLACSGANQNLFFFGVGWGILPVSQGGDNYKVSAEARERRWVLGEGAASPLPPHQSRAWGAL